MTNLGMYELCKIYYNKKTLEHAERVAERAKNLCKLFNLPYENYNNFIYQLGLAHDLYEDTNIKKYAWFDYNFDQNLMLLTKEKDMDYTTYINRIFDMARSKPDKYLPAYIVKIADIIDHFAQKDTLTDKLKNKYIEALPLLFQKGDRK